MATVAGKTHQVVIFTTPSCSWCKRLKTYLIQKQVRFKEIDVSRDFKAARDIERRSGSRGVPVTLIDNRPVVGFDQAKIDRMLGL